MTNLTLGSIAKTSFAIALALFIVITPKPAKAATSSSGGGFMIGISALKLDTGTSGATLGNNDTSTTILDLKAGWTMADGLYVGGIYDTRTDETNGSKNERTGFGATIGYHNAGWFIDGSYFLSSTYKMSGGTEVKEGSGFGVDVGHNMDLTANIYLGLQISYKSLTYNKTGSTAETNKLKSELMPMLNVGVMF